MNTCVIMQPTYLPWLGYFDLIEKSNIFIFLDHVQFSKQSWQQRNKIRNKNGELILTIPIQHTGHKEALIKEIKIDVSKKPLFKHLKSIELNYGKAKNFKIIFNELTQIYNKEYLTLQSLNVDLILLGCKLMKIPISYLFSSSLDVEGQKVDALIDICKKVNATHYLSPIGSKNYIDENNIFGDNEIVLKYQNFVPPIYKQIQYNNFISQLSFIDYLFNI